MMTRIIQDYDTGEFIVEEIRFTSPFITKELERFNTRKEAEKYKEKLNISK